MRSEPQNSCAGWCRQCSAYHQLPFGNAQRKGVELFRRLERDGSIGQVGDRSTADPLLLTAPLFGEARGKMFGVLECRAESGNIVWLYAFSGQYNGLWLVPGWVPPLFDVNLFTRINTPAEHRIKVLSQHLAELPEDSDRFAILSHERKVRSQNLMEEIHDLYRVPNFRGQEATLAEAFGTKAGMPTGTGDCCAPKLLNHAARRNLVPISLAEFYFGRENRSGRRRHGNFYPPCREKCLPLLGFMLCGSGVA